MRPIYFCLLALLMAVNATAQAPVPGRNVNMVSEDPYLQKQNEPSIAISTRNPCHLLAGANDYRTVNLPGLPGDEEIGDAWVGLYKSIDCGQTWLAELMHGFPQDQTEAGLASPVHGFTTAADPYVRAGAAGTFYYSFIAFNRGTNNGKLAIGRLIDNNDREAGDTFQYLGQTIVDHGSSGQFIDKPALAVSLGTGTCAIGGQTVPATNVYSAWSVFVGNDNNIRSKLYFARSSNCAISLDGPAVKVSEGLSVNQGSVIGVDEASGSSNIYVVWRQFSPDNVVFARSSDGGRSFSKGEVVSSLAGVPLFEQTTTPDTFRTRAFPTVAVDGAGTLHLFIAARVGPLGPASVRDSRIVHTSLARGATTWSALRQVEPASGRGHQIMPAAALAGGKLNVIWYDLRDDVSGVYNPQINESEAIPFRHTLDVRGAQATLVAGQPPVFETYGVLQLSGSDRLSQYPLGNYYDAQGNPRSGQLQFNRPNMRLYAGGTWPFMGDYIDIGGLQYLQDPNDPQRWFPNASDPLAAFHAVWTDNRDARDVPGNPATVPYTAPGTIPLASCTPTLNAQGVSRNANVYTSRIAPGIELILPGNSKPATGIQRAFSLRIANHTAESRLVHLTLASLQGATASFRQLDPSVQSIDVNVGPRSSAARTVYIASPTDPYPQVLVTAVSPGLPELHASTVINRDRANPAIQNPIAARASTSPIGTTEVHNPDIQNPDIQNPDIQNPDIQNPDIQNPDIQNPDIQNPDIQNPDIQNPDIQNPDIQNPDVQNPDIQNPDIQNPDIQNPDIQNPDIQNPDIQNGSLTDATVAITNTGNTTSSYQVNTSVSGDTGSFIFQLIGSRIVRRPSNKDCRLTFVRENQILFNEPLPDLNVAFTDPNDSSRKNTTVQIAPGDTVYVTLRVYDPDPTDAIAFCPPGSDNPACVGQPPTHGVQIKAKAEAINVNTDGPVDDEPASDESAVLAPDLVIDGPLSVTPATIVAGDLVEFSGASARNAGQVTAYGDGGFENTYYASTDPSVTGEDRALFTTDGRPPLVPGATESLFKNFSTPADLAVGVYYLGIIADSGGDVGESDETNNSVVAPATITVVNRPSIETAALPAGQVASVYTQTLAASGGVGGLKWSWAPAPCTIECAFAPAIPPGLALSTGGVISGTPTTSGAYGVIIAVADSTPGAETNERHSDAEFFIVQVLAGQTVVFVQHPPSPIAPGITFPIAVRVQDETGAPIPGGIVTLRLDDNPSGASMIPATAAAVTNVDGQATFPIIAVDSVGTFRLRGTVSTVGYSAAVGFSNVFWVTDLTFVGPAGGPGGEPFGPFLCADGAVGTALRGRAGDDLDRTELWCSTLDGTTLGDPVFAGGVGGDTGAAYDMTCNPGFVMTGVHGRAGIVTWGGNVVDTLGVTCTDLASTEAYNTPATGVPSGETALFSLNCPAGTRLVGIQGRQGALLDQITIACR